MSKKELFLGSIHDAVGDIFYYNRKGDEELSAEDIDNLIANGGVSLQEMVDAFKNAILEEYDIWFGFQLFYCLSQFFLAGSV